MNCREGRLLQSSLLYPSLSVSGHIFASATLMPTPNILCIYYCLLCIYYCQASIREWMITTCFGRCSEDEMQQSRPHIKVQRKRGCQLSGSTNVACFISFDYIADKLVQTRPLCLTRFYASIRRSTLRLLPDSPQRGQGDSRDQRWGSQWVRREGPSQG